MFPSLRLQVAEIKVNPKLLEEEKEVEEEGKSKIKRKKKEMKRKKEERKEGWKARRMEGK